MRALLRDDGNAVVEVIPAAFVLLIFIALITAGGRITHAAMAVQDAARNAARQASIARTPLAAAAAARTSALGTLASDQLACRPAVTVNTAGFNVPPGQPALVTAAVTCNVSLAGLTGIPGIPGSRLVTAVFSSPLDLNRAR